MHVGDLSQADGHAGPFQTEPRAIITEVAFTVAIASTPGASPSSSTESAGHRRRDEERPGLDLHQRHHAVDLHRGRTTPGIRLRAENCPLPE